MDIETWGIDWNGPLPTPDSATTVEVPAPLPVLQDTIETQLKTTTDPLRPSEVYGVDIYMEALRIAQTLFASNV